MLLDSDDCFLKLRSGSEGALIDQSLTVNPSTHRRKAVVEVIEQEPVTSCRLTSELPARWKLECEPAGQGRVDEVWPLLSHPMTRRGRYFSQVIAHFAHRLGQSGVDTC